MKTLSSAFSAAALFTAAIVSPPTAVAYDAIVHPASCVAPYLDQAMPMRWHENYIMNPSENPATWVICPIEHHNVSVNVNWVVNVEVVLSSMTGAEPQPPQCYASVHSAANEKWGEHKNGPQYTVTKPLPITSYEGTTIVTAHNTLSMQELRDTMGAAANIVSPASVFCRLPSGWGINAISVIEL